MSGIYKGIDYLKGRFEVPPYDQVRNTCPFHYKARKQCIWSQFLVNNNCHCSPKNLTSWRHSNPDLPFLGWMWWPLRHPMSLWQNGAVVSYHCQKIPVQIHAGCNFCGKHIYAFVLKHWTL
jgi:hypothetical protein